MDAPLQSIPPILSKEQRLDIVPIHVGLTETFMTPLEQTGIPEEELEEELEDDELEDELEEELDEVDDDVVPPELEVDDVVVPKLPEDDTLGLHESKEGLQESATPIFLQQSGNPPG